VLPVKFIAQISVQGTQKNPFTVDSDASNHGISDTNPAADVGADDVGAIIPESRDESSVVIKSSSSDPAGADQKKQETSAKPVTLESLTGASEEKPFGNTERHSRD
ncbi:MAG: hypothetical protein AAF714_12560, partial [Pseudomonadota bacterium]